MRNNNKHLKLLCDTIQTTVKVWANQLVAQKQLFSLQKKTRDNNFITLQRKLRIKKERKKRKGSELNIQNRTYLHFFRELSGQVYYCLNAVTPFNKAMFLEFSMKPQCLFRAEATAFSSVETNLLDQGPRGKDNTWYYLPSCG